MNLFLRYHGFSIYQVLRTSYVQIVQFLQKEGKVRAVE